VVDVGNKIEAERIDDEDWGRTVRLWACSSVHGDVESAQDATVERGSLLNKKHRVKRCTPMI
jgi:hypothetical protein